MINQWLVCMGGTLQHFVSSLLGRFFSHRKTVDRKEMMKNRLLYLLRKYEYRFSKDKADLREEFDIFAGRLRHWFVKAFQLSGQMTFTRLKRDLEKFDMSDALKERIYLLCDAMMELEYKEKMLSIKDAKEIISHVKFIATEL